MRYILDRTTLGWCWWDLIALVVLVGVAAVYYMKIKKMKETEKELEARLGGETAAEAVPGESK